VRPSRHIGRKCGVVACFVFAIITPALPAWADYWYEHYARSETALEAEDWSIEGRGPNSLFREGWRPGSFRAGDKITIRFNPMRDGSFAGGFIGAQFADGSTIGRWTE